MGRKLAGGFLCLASHLLCYRKITLSHLENAGRQESRKNILAEGTCEPLGPKRPSGVGGAQEGRGTLWVVRQEAEGQMRGL